MTLAEEFVITESETYEYKLGNYSADYVERAVKAYERRQATNKAYYERKKQDPQWMEQRREKDRARRLKKKMGTLSKMI